MASSTGERALAKAADRVESTRHAALLDAAPDAIVVVSADGRIVLVNTRTERLFAYRREELLGRSVEAILPGWTGSVHPDPQARYIADLRTRPLGAGLEMGGRRKDGGEFPAEISLSALAVDDGMLVTAVIRDGTDRARDARRQQALQRRHEHAQRLETLGHLAGTISHDFNNLFGVIFNYANFVAEEIGHNETAQADIQQIRVAAEQAMSLTRQLSQFRRRAPQPQLLDLNAVVCDSAPLLARASGDNIEIVVCTTPGLPSTWADREQLDQILLDLAVNAGDAMPSGGTLTIETASVLVDHDNAEFHAELPPGRYVTLTVSDTGEGMSSDVVDRAFEPFFTTRAGGERSGLGLTRVYGIVTEARGALTLHSDAGSGTTARVYLPSLP